MTKFADQLFNDLIREHGDVLTVVQRPVPQARRTVRRPVWVAGLAAGAAGAGTAGVVLLGGSPAYAVNQNGDGTVKIAVNRESGITGANSALHAKGLRVVLVPVGSGCPDLNSLAVPANPGSKLTVSSRTGDDDGSITIGASGIPAGLTALVGVDSEEGRSRMAMVLIKGTPPECVSLPAGPPPGTGSSDGGPSLTKNNQDNGASTVHTGG